MVNGRRKGHQEEREICKRLRPLFPDVERTQEGDSLDRAGVDVRGTGVFRIQSKVGRRYAPVNTIEEVQVSDGIPLLWTRADRKKAVVCLYADDFLKILEDIGIVYNEKS